ncbi:peptidase [Spirochaetia bacterium]|nr:peptidase [Spirochaetia bacterium]
MKTWLKTIALGLSLALLMTACSSIAKGVRAGIKSVTAITEVFGDGQKVTAVAIEYGTIIAAGTLSAADYSVMDQTIVKVYTNTNAAKAENGTSGNYVILELAVEDTADLRSGAAEVNGQGSPQGGPSGQRPDFVPGEGGSNRGPGGGPGLGSAGDNAPPSNHLTVSVTQNKDIAAKNGQRIAGTKNSIESNRTINLVVDDFQQLVFKELMYNLFVPKNYDPAKAYPLVLFMVDAGGVGTDPVKTLTQGLGAVIWATPEEQAKHECFVLAPQYTRVMADDNSETTEDMDITIDLIRDLITRYNIDANRIYNTGQSMGCMTSIAMNIKYPQMFAASFLVAGQWDAAKVAPMAGKPLWIVVSEGDTKANPGMDAITEVLKAKGDTVSKATWNSRVTATEFDTYVADMLAKRAGINYTVFEGGSHTYTWKVAYTIEGIRDWLFRQQR